MDGLMLSDAQEFLNGLALPLPDLHQWLLRAQPGSQTTYHVGELGRDRIGKENKDLHQRAGLLSWAAGVGLVELFQRRLGDRAFEYIAHRTAELWHRPMPMRFGKYGWVAGTEYAEISGLNDDLEEVE